MPNIEDLPDYFGKAYDMQGRMLDSEGEPIEDWIVALRQMAERAPKKNYRLVPNIERGKQVAKAILECKRLVESTDGKARVDVDDACGSVNLQIRGKDIRVSDIPSFIAAASCADNVSACAFTDGTASIDIIFYGLYDREEIE